MMNVKFKEIKLICPVCEKEVDPLDANSVPVIDGIEGRDRAHQECFQRLRNEYYREE
jgi:hypothetical protein